MSKKTFMLSLVEHEMFYNLGACMSFILHFKCFIMLFSGLPLVLTTVYATVRGNDDISNKE